VQHGKIDRVNRVVVRHPLNQLRFVRPPCYQRKAGFPDLEALHAVDLAQDGRYPLANRIDIDKGVPVFRCDETPRAGIVVGVHVGKRRQGRSLSHGKVRIRQEIVDHHDSGAFVTERIDIDRHQLSSEDPATGYG